MSLFKFFVNSRPSSKQQDTSRNSSLTKNRLLKPFARRRKGDSKAVPGTLPQFVNVQKLLRGRSLRTPAEPSLLLFTVHKSASAYLRHVLHQLAVSANLASADFEGFAQTKSDEELRNRYGDDIVDIVFGAPSHPPQNQRALQRRLRTAFPVRGCFVGALRRPHVAEWLPHADEIRKLVVLRDPRDVMTSFYFSKAYSHRPPLAPERRERFENERRKCRDMEIDDWVLEQSPVLVKRYDAYCRMITRPLVHCAPYESLVGDFEQWLDGVIDFWGLPVDPEVRSQLLEQADFSVSEEDVYSHKRQVQPGDHARKLRGDTIAELNRRFGPVLDTLGYARDVTRRDAA